MTMLRIFIIPADDSQPVLEGAIQEERALEEMQVLVGGFIEMPVWRAGRRVGVWPVINEEGKFDQVRHPRNERATALLKADLWPEDWIAGDCILVGGNETTGDTVSLPDAFTIDALMAAIQQEVGK